MLHPSGIEQKLGFDVVKSWLSNHCQFDCSRQMVENIRFSAQYDTVTTLLTQTHEMKFLISTGNVPGPKCADAAVFLKNIRIKETYLELQEMLDIANAMQSAFKIHAHISAENDISTLHESGLLVFFDKSIVKKILSKFDDNGGMRDDASPELKKIKRNLRKAQGNIRKSLDHIFKEAKKAGYIPDNTGPTIRDGRLVIPVHASSKRKISGFIHDESSSGHTVYLEPTEVLEANNAIVDLGYAEKREIIKILRSLTDAIRADIDAIESAFQYLCLIDFIIAKARLSIEMEGELPEISGDPIITMENARHPVLLHNYKGTGRLVVPLKVNLNKKERIILISGPNAGGKSVCLKTVGLLQYMLQCGLLIPVDKDSKIGLFKDIFVDLGDEQSIENDLSTYSSHLENMRIFITACRKESLILIDEFGTGTDPKFGGAIAEAILEKLLQSGCLGVITTHYSNLKEFAQKSAGIVNGAMQFDLENLEPLYTLEAGRPGSSFALEVARKIGIPKNVLKKARQIAGSDSVQVESLINKLTEEKRALSVKLGHAKNMERDLGEKIELYQNLFDELDSRKKEIINNAKSEAQNLLNQANKNIEKTIRHIKENKAQKKETKRLREKLSKYKERIRPEIIRRLPDEVHVYLEGAIQAGDFVFINSTGMTGKVLTIKGKSAKLISGDLKMHAKLADMKRIKPPQHAFVIKTRSVQGLDIVQKQKSFSTQLDVRGRRAEEIARILDSYIDDALLLGHHEVKILHGKGDGVLRKVIKEHLNSFTEVVSAEDDHIERGGAGITVVKLK